MFVAFHAECSWILLWSALEYYCASRSRRNSNLIRIQIGLEFTKDLKIKKPFSSFLLATGRIPPSRCNLASYSSLTHRLHHGLVRPSSFSTWPTPARPTPSVLLAMMKQTPPGKSPLSLIFNGNDFESKWKNVWSLSPHLSRALEWKPL
jgi:hypothetical protein